MSIHDKPPTLNTAKEVQDRIDELEAKIKARAESEENEKLTDEFLNSNPTEEQESIFEKKVREVAGIEEGDEGQTEASKSWKEFQEDVENDTSLDYQQKMAKLHEEYDKRNPGNKGSEGEGKETEEDNRTPEEIRVDDARNIYVKEYLKCKKEVRNKVAIDRAKASILNFFKSKDKKTTINEEDYFSDEYKEAKKIYDQARIDLGNDLFNKKRIELSESGVSGSELDTKLKEYKATEILTKTIIEERNKLIQAKAEGSPINPATWRRLLHAYSKLTKTQKLLLSTAIFAGAGAAGFIGVGAGLGAATGVRLARGIFSMGASALAAKGIDRYNKKGNEAFQSGQEAKLAFLKNQFGEGQISQEEYEKQSEDIEAENRKRARNQALLKAGVGIAIGAGVGALTSYEMGGMGSHHVENTQNNIADTTHLAKGDSTLIDQDTTTTPIEQTAEPIEAEQIPPVIQPHASIEAIVGKGDGAIRTIEDLQDKLRAEYPEGAERPASVQHILDTKADKLAIEYGMFKPGEAEESAMFKVGGKFSVDESGNVSYQETADGSATILEKGTDAKVTEVYKGDMFDSDRGHNMGTNNTSAEFKDNSFYNDPEYEKYSQSIAQEIPNGASPDINLNPIEGNNIPQDIPGGAEEIPSGNGITNPLNPESGATPNNIPEAKDVTPAGPSERVYATGGARPVYPTGAGGRIDTPRVSDNTGNGFTKEVPLTNRAAMESGYNARENLINTPNIKEAIDGKGNWNLIDSDPRHLETASDVKARFGDNVILDRKGGSTINGIDNKEWNTTTHNMLSTKALNSEYTYADAERDLELQRLFGHGEKAIAYNPEIDKNVEGINMEYFRETPEWNTVNKIPAKDFFDFNEAKLSGRVSDNELNMLIEKGVVEDNIDTDGNHDYSFVHEKELERLSNFYDKLDPLNSKPIGDENIEKYISRLTKDVHQTDNGTYYAFKDENIEKSLDDGTFGRQEGRGLNRPRGGNVVPRRTYGGGGNYSPEVRRLADRALGNIRSSQGWTRPVRNWTY